MLSLVPVGGGLISGVSTYIKETDPRIEVIGVEAEGARSMKAALKQVVPSNCQKSISLQTGLLCKSGTIDL